MALAEMIPSVPGGSWELYEVVERFLIDLRASTDRAFLDDAQTAPTYDDVGRLTRLADDLRIDAIHLEQLAQDVEELIDERVAELRDAERL
jgi:hypothetical protein